MRESSRELEDTIPGVRGRNLVLRGPAECHAGDPSGALARPGAYNQARMTSPLLNRRYRIVRPLGTGGMASVFLAEDREERGRSVAVKVLSSGARDARTLDYFRHEFRCLAGLAHPHLARVHDFGVVEDPSPEGHEAVFSPGRPFFTMEYVEGGDLFAATAALDPRGVVQLVLQVCLGLEYIHSRGYIHCDVKPANLLVAGAPPRPSGPASWSVRIVDLGLAQFESQSLPQLPRGTVHYMAPEQFRGGHIDRRADLYSLGVVLYQVLSRRLPFPGETANEVIQKRLESRPPSIRAVRADVPPPLEEVVLRLLSRDPADRPPTAASAAQELADAVGIEFRPDARPVRESYILSGRFVGRQEAVTRIRALLPGASRSGDRPRAVAVVHGPVGIGKSRLLREVRQQAQLQEMPVHAVSCGAGGSPIMALLASVAEAVGPRIEAALERSPDVRALLEAPGVPSIPAERDALDPEKERLRLVQGIAGILLEAARIRPFVGVVEDLHAGDDFSLEVLHQIARSAYFGAASPASLLIVCSRTPELEEGQPSAPQLARLIADPAVLTIELGPLTREDTAELVGSMLGQAAIPEGFVEALHAESAGNPLFLEEYMRALVDQEVVQYRSGRWRFAPGDARRIPVPASIEAVLRQRLAGIGRERMRLLFAISCFPEGVALPIVQALLGPGEVLYDGLDSLERRGLLVKEPGPAFRFAHGWTREQVYRRIPLRRRRRIHEAIARTLIDVSLGDWRGRPEEVAWHLLRGPTPEDALDSLLASAGRARVAYQNARAAALFEEALGLLKRNEGPRKRAVLENLGTLYGLMGDTDRAVKAYRQLLGMAKSDHEPGEVARTCRKLAEVLSSKGEHDEADGWLTRALAALPTGKASLVEEDAAERARILQQSAWSQVQRGRYQDGIKTCEAALALCGDTEDERTRAAILNVLGTAEFSIGDFTPAFDHLEQSLAIRERADNLQGVAGSLLNLGVSYYYTGNLARARQALERTRAISEKIGDIRVTAYAQNNLGLVLHAMGRRDEALARYRESLEIQRRLGNPAGIVPCLVNIGNLHRERPDISAALASFEEALSYSQLTENAQGKALSWNNLSEVYLYLGDLPRAEEMAENARSLARERRSRREEAFVEALLGQIAAHRQRWQEAVERLTGCVDLFVRINMRSNAGDAVLALAETLSRKGDRAGCLGMLDRIGTEFVEQRPPAFLAWMEFLRGTCTEGAEGEKCLRNAAERCADAGILEPTWQVHHALARIAHKRGDHVAAGRLYKQALDSLRQIFATVPGPYRASFFNAEERQQLRRDILSLKSDARRKAPTQAEETRKRLNATVQLLKEENRRLSGLIEINKRMNTEHDLDRILSFIVDTAVDLSRAERGFVILSDGKGGIARVVARNVDRQDVGSPETEFSHGIAKEVLRRGEAIVTSAAAEEGEYSAYESVLDLKLLSVLCVPLNGREGTVGALYMENRAEQGIFTDMDRHTLEALAAQGATAVENARLIGELLERKQQLEVTKAEAEALNERLSEMNRRLVAQAESQSAELKAQRALLEDRLKELTHKYDYAKIVAQSPRMRELFGVLDRITDSALPVLIQGESGTGKDLVARAIHYNGPRKDRYFAAVNCGAVSETLLESELFGHARGAFTGADSEKKGLFELSHHGTVFLDEVGDMSPEMQKKLLRVLETHEIRKVGGKEIQKVDVRILSASNKDLRDLVEKGQFREDLLYRLNVFTVTLPPLRERKEDIPLLAEHFLTEAAAETKQRRKRLAKAAMELLQRYPWPGNVRELRNVVLGVASLADGETLGPEDFAPRLQMPEEGAPLATTSEATLAQLSLDDYVKAFILTYQDTMSVGDMARTLGLNRKTIWKYRKAWGIAGKN